MSGNAPAKKLRIGNVTATIWRNNSGERSFYTVTLAVNYKDSEGNWKAGDNLSHSDLLVAANLLQRANSWIMEQ